MILQSPARLPLARKYNLIAKKNSNSSISLNKRCIIAALSSKVSSENNFFNNQNNEQYPQDSVEELPGFFEDCDSFISQSNALSTASEMEEEEEEIINSSYSSQSNNDFLESISMNESKEGLQRSSAAEAVASGNLNISSSKGKNLRLLNQVGMRRFFEDAEEEHFRQLEDRINDWLDAEGVNQVEPNAQRKSSQDKQIVLSCCPVSSSLLARRKLRSIGVNSFSS